MPQAPGSLPFDILNYLDGRFRGHSERFDEAHANHDERLRALESFRDRFLGSVTVAAAVGGIGGTVVGGVIVAVVLKAMFPH